jgi:hypothetical protein
MFNLTHNEDSAIDIGGVWTGPDEFELTLKFNADGMVDTEVYILLSRSELQGFVRYLDTKLTMNKLRNM